MIGPGSDAKVMICTQPIDFRKGIDSLVALIQNEFRSDPFSGVVWVFRSKRADRAKILWWDTSGIWLMTKRLEDGRFSWPKEHDGMYRINAAELSALAGGMDWRRVQPKRRVIPPKIELDRGA